MQEHLNVPWDQASRGAKALVWLIQQLRRAGTAVVVARLQHQWAMTDGIQAGHGFLPDVLGYSRLGSTHSMARDTAWCPCMAMAGTQFRQGLDHNWKRWRMYSCSNA